jgi:hypothetical protein
MVAWSRTRDWRELQKRRREREDRDQSQSGPAESCEGVQSTCIAAMAYDGKDEMTLTFQSGGTYKYHGVGPEEYDAFCKAESKGKHFHRFVRGRYPSVKVG